MRTVLETVEAAGRLSPTEARTLLACFLFREGEVFKRVRDLSAGERVEVVEIRGATALVMH